MTASATSLAIDHAKHGRRVALCCPPDENGACRCGGKWDDKLKQLVPHAPKEVGKAPIGRFFPAGINDATTKTARLDGFLRQMPDANVSVDLASTGWLVVDPDSEETEAAELAQGLAGAVVRESRHRAYVFRRPADCPAVNLIKKDDDPLDILTVGNFLVGGVHATGARIWMDPNADPGPAPTRYVEMLKAKAAANTTASADLDAKRAEWATQYGDGQEPPVRLHQRGQRRWRGELVEAPNGQLDRDLSLWYIGLDLAECGATPGAIIEALKERDVFLGWEKFTHRKDDREYVKIAEKVVASAIEKEQAPQIKVTKPADVPDDVAALRAALEAAEARIAHLERALMDRDDRLEILEPIVTAIDEILARPEVETDDDGNVIRYGPTSDDKLVNIGCARFMPHWRAKKNGRGEAPTIALGYLSKVLGMPKKRISKSLERQSSKDPNAGAPFRKIVTRQPKFDDDGVPVINRKTGKQEWESSLEVIPWGDSPAATLQAGATYDLPARPKHGGSEKASAVRWGRCDKHDNQEVRVKGYCPDCGKVVGERIMPLSEFDALNVQVGHSETRASPTVPVNSIERQNGHSDHAHRGSARQKVQVVDSDVARATAIVGIPLTRDVDAWKRLESRDRPEPVSIGQIREAHQQAQEQPAWVDEWPDRDQEPAPPPDRCVFCPEPLAAGSRIACADHQREMDGAPLPAVSGGSE
jgi:hypothetical protein